MSYCSTSSLHTWLSQHLLWEIYIDCIICKTIHKLTSFSLSQKYLKPWKWTRFQIPEGDYVVGYVVMLLVTLSLVTLFMLLVTLLCYWLRCYVLRWCFLWLRFSVLKTNTIESVRFHRKSTIFNFQASFGNRWLERHWFGFFGGGIRFWLKT